MLLAGGRLASAAAIAPLALALLLPAAAQGAPPSATPSAASAKEGELTATIRRTAHGIPHILADDYAGLGFGYGYAFAQDNLCVIADQYVTVRAERSRFFGPDASWTNRANGTTNNNLNSDFFFKRIIDDRTVEKLIEQSPPHGPRAEIREGVRGYVAGYNQYLRDTGVGNLPDPSCRGREWVRPIEEIDAYRRFYQLALLASGAVAVDGIGGAQPPTPPLNGGQPFAPSDLPEQLPFPFDAFPLGALGSNAYGLGREATQSGRGMVLANPHFPWLGSERFYQAHLTIPGKVDVSGASLFGVPLVLIGHTRGMAWSHTVSTAFRFTPFELKLVPGSPTTYIYDGQPREMTAQAVTVQVRAADGTLEPRTRTLYSSHHGPVFTSILGLPLFPWTPSQAHAMGDANAANFRYLNHFFETNHAHTVRELDEVLRRNQGIPWVNTIAADSKGEAYYADLSVVPHVTNQKAQECNTALGAAAFAALRLPVLDGSRSACEWGRDDDAIQPGTFGPKNLPHLFRNDYVTNGNDSYWLSNPKQPLTGFARIIGDEETARSLRTRLGLIMVEQRMAGSDGRPGKGFTLPQLQETVFSNRQYAAELWRDELVQMCNANPTIESSGGPVDVSAACPILAAWDMRDDLDSRGAVLFRRFASRALGTGGQPYSQPFSSSDPVNTPRGLNTGNPQVRQALGDAVKDLRDSGIPLDARLREYQFVMRGQEKIPIHGGPGTVGVFNAINVSWVPGQGYPNVPHGSSFVMTTHLNGSCPDARSILTYSQSTNPESPYFGDQTRMFSRKEWVDLPFCEREIQRDPALTACTASAGSDAVVVRRRGRGLSVRGAKGTARPTAVELYRVATRNRVTRYRLVARFRRRGSSFTWSGRPRVADGHYVLRVKRGSGRAATTRRLALRRSAGRYRVGPDFERRETCRLLTSFRLSRPVFGGRTRNSLGISYRVAFPADVRIEVLRGRRVIRTFRRSGRRAGRTHREKLRSRGLRTGRYRVRITARWRRATETATLTAARL